MSGPDSAHCWAASCAGGSGPAHGLRWWLRPRAAMVLPASSLLLAARLRRAKRDLPYVTEDVRGMLKNQNVAEAWSGRSWLKVPEVPSGSVTSKGVQLQCEACGCVLRIKAWKWCNLIRHQKSKPHLRAVLGKLGVDGRDLAPVPGAPSASSFAAVWKEFRSGKSPRQGCEDVGCRGKVWRMLCCLAEAMYALDRSFLKRSPGDTVVAIHRDEKNGRLQVDFTASDRELRTRAGTMGIIDNKGGTLGIVDSTKEIVERFWTDVSGSFDENACNNFRHAVELVNTDAAPDEVAACREQSRPSMPELRVALTPNVKVVARDRAHGSQRRGWGIFKDCIDIDSLIQSLFLQLRVVRDGLNLEGCSG